MSTRKIIEIDNGQCTGCGLCIPNCPEGALQVIDGKVRLVSDLFCDGLGACIGYCPEAAIRVVEREAEPYDERKVMANIARQGANTVRAHLEHLREHGEENLLGQALGWMADNGVPVPEGFGKESSVDQGSDEHHGCPGARAMELKPVAGSTAGAAPSAASAAPAARSPSSRTGRCSCTSCRPWRPSSRAGTCCSPPTAPRLPWARSTTGSSRGRCSRSRAPSWTRAPTSTGRS